MISYLSAGNDWVDNKGKSVTPKIGDVIDMDLCDGGWKDSLFEKGFAIKYVKSLPIVARGTQ